jgi:BRCA1 C Terminus (BRCT) domain
MASLQGVVIAFAGLHTASEAFADKKISEVKELIKACGGFFVSKVTGEVTHLVATPAQFAKNGVKVKESANHPGIKIVDFEW